MSNVFISYSRKDRLFADKLCQALTKVSSQDVWIDWEDIPPSAKWWAEITAAITAADAFLFLISPDSANSKTCKAEIAEAVKLHKRILPLLVRDTADDTVPADVGELNWILLRDSDDFATGLKQLGDALNTDLDWVRTHSRLLVRGVEWENHQEDDSYLLRGADLEIARTWLAGASNKKPDPAPLHYRYLNASQQAQAREIEKLRSLYNNALARQLAAQCTLLQRESDARLDRSILLAVESMRRVPNAEADWSLRQGLRLRAQEISSWRDGGSGLLSVSANGELIATCESDNVAVITGAGNFQPIRRISVDGKITALGFVPNSTCLAIGTDDGALTCVKADTGERVMEGRHPGRIGAVAGSIDGSALLAL